MDEVLLEGMRFYGYHGVNPEEQALGQRFVIDMAVQADLSVAGRSDNVDDTISYSDIFHKLRPIVEAERFDLLEALGQRIVDIVFREFPRAERVTVTIRKPGVAIRGSILDAAGVRLTRTRPSES